MLMYKRIYFKLISKMAYYYYTLFDKNINISKGLSIRSNVNFNVNGGKLFIGKNCFFNNGCSINSREKIVIGSNCLFGENVHIYDHNHRYSENKPVSLQGFTTKEVSIGDNCWVGTGTTILKGVKIGSNCVIGANCLIYYDIPSYSIVKSSQELIIKAIDKGI